MRRRLLVLVILVAVAISAWLIYSKVTQARREAAYRVVLAPFQRDLSPGMARSEVEKYLDSRGVKYTWVFLGGRSAKTDLVEIGEEPGGFACEAWRVYVAMDFDASNHLRVNYADTKLDPSDKLKAVYVEKIGTCL